MAEQAKPEQDKPEQTNSEASVKPRSKSPRRKGSDVAAEMPELAKIENDLIVINPDFWFKKRFEDIQEAASELPVVVEYINESLQRAFIASTNAKRDLEALEAETYVNIRQNWSQIYSDKMTEKALEMAVAQDEKLLKASENYSVLKSYVTRLSNMQENLRAKLDMIRSAEATRRKLIEDDPSDS